MTTTTSTAAAAPETPVVFDCGDASLLGIVHAGGAGARRGVLIVVGGPQYRVGSHRQFLLLARALAAAGVPAMRFDYRGMGDSGGDYLGFEHIGDDIGAAIDAFQRHCPSLEEIVLWGLCDAASAILFHAHADRRVAGIVLLNPWVHSEAGAARAYLKHYYIARALDPAFWRKLAGGGFRPGESLKGMLGLIRTARRQEAPDENDENNDDGANQAAANDALAARMAEGLAKFEGRVLLILSGRDLTAREFEDAAARSEPWRRLLDSGRIRRHHLKPADHTFSRADWRAQVEQWTVEWVGES